MNWTYDNPYEYWNKRHKEQGKDYVAHRQLKNFDQQVHLGKTLCGHHMPAKGSSALDFGCGVGRFQEWLHSIADKVTAVDYVKSALDTVDLITEGKTRTVHYSKLPLPLDDGEFDLIWTFTVLQHIVDRDIFEATCRELNRVASHGARFVMVENRADEAPHVARRSPDEYCLALGIDMVLHESVDIDKPKSHWLIVGQK